MTDSADATDQAAAFIARWQHADGTELANAQMFVGELCKLLDVPLPDPARADTADNAYVFERRIIFRHGDGGRAEGRIDCYRRGAFVLEAKKLKSGGADVPDDSARVALERYVKPRCAEWPAADVVVGNPPFIGAAGMRVALGDGYVEALRGVWKDVPESADFVMYWWHHAAQLVARGKLSRFGFITTNSLRQTFNRRIVQAALDDGLHLAFAVPDHPWVDSADGAAVRIAMTVAAPSAIEGRLLTVTTERNGNGEGLEVELAERTGMIHADLTTGANVASAQALRANENLSNRGFQLFGAGFIVTPDEASHLEADAPIKPYRNGRDLTDRPRGVKVIDLFGLTAEEVRSRYPSTFQWVLERVKPERDHNNREGRKRNWWLFGEPNPKLRRQLAGLSRYIATVETAKHRTFQFLDSAIAADNMLVCVALEDGYTLGVLSSHIHVVWALATGGTLEDRPRYNKSRCFETFPFPAATPAQQARIRDLACQLDAHRKRVLAEHQDLTLTGLYNVLEKLKSSAVLNTRDKDIHQRGLVAVMQSLHAELDAAVLAAYGWTDLVGQAADDATILDRLVALNLERTTEEAAGTIRWLRPEFQNPDAQNNRHSRVGGNPESLSLDLDSGSAAAAGRNDGKLAWPTALPDQVAAIARLLAETQSPLTLAQLATRFSGKGKWKSRLPDILGTLAALGRARVLEDGRWMG